MESFPSGVGVGGGGLDLMNINMNSLGSFDLGLAECRERSGLTLLRAGSACLF